MIYTEAETRRLCAYDAANDSVITIAENGTAPVVSGDKVYYVNENGGIDSISLVDGSKTAAAEACSSNIVVQDSTVYYIVGTKICALSDGSLPSCIPLLMRLQRFPHSLCVTKRSISQKTAR